MIVVVTGVAGSGKTTVGKAAAERLGWRFADADDYHSDAAIERIRRGEPLDDEARFPWLERIRALITTADATGESLVIACSALKERYRQILAAGSPAVRFVFLSAGRQLLEERLTTRPGHFAGTSILDSQLETLEPPSYGLHLDASRRVDELADAVAGYATASR